MSTPNQATNAQAVNEPQKPIFNTIMELERFAKETPVTMIVMEAPQLMNEEGLPLDPEAPPEYMIGLCVLLPNQALVGGVMAYNKTFETMEEAAEVAKALSEGNADAIEESLIAEYAVNFHLIPEEPVLDIATAQYKLELTGTIEIGDFALNHLSVPVAGFGAGFPDMIKAKQQYDIYKKNHESYLAHIEKRKQEVIAKMQEEVEISIATAPTE